MWMYVLRRLGVAFLVLLGTSFIVYLLMSISGDPLADLRASNDPNREALIQSRIQLLNLDQPVVQRYFTWLAGAAGCAVPGMQCNLGQTMAGTAVSSDIAAAAGQTLRMVVMASLLSMIIGTTIGVITALRQYTSFDYGTTFMVFLFFALPSFWLAVLLKEFGAIQFNDFLADPSISVTAGVVVGLVLGLVVAGAAGGSRKQFGITVAAGVAAGVAITQFLTLTDWFSKPSLGMHFIALIGLASAFLFTIIIAGLRNRKALYSALTMVGIGVVLYIPIQPVLNNMSFFLLFVLALITIGVGWGVGRAFGGYDYGQNQAVAALTGFVVALTIVLDKFMLYWPVYADHPRIKGRPIATLGSQTPNFEGNFWMTNLDSYTHVLLPTLSFLLLGIAAYSRYARATMLETMNQDYVRTARAKGLSERVVVVKHAFRNTLVPISTIIALEIGNLLGGAVISERIFAWAGVGSLFMEGLLKSDPNPVMGVWLVTSTMSMIFIIVADLLYSVLDPRVRVK